MKDEILFLLSKGYSVRDVAARIGCLPEYVRTVRARDKRLRETGTMQLPSEIGYTVRRYKHDPVYRAKANAANNRYITQRRKIDAEFRERTNTYSREYQRKRATDPAFVEHRRFKQRSYRARRREQQATEASGRTA
jgi:hypothetical protein